MPLIAKDKQNNPEKVCKVDVHEVAELKVELKVAVKVALSFRKPSTRKPWPTLP